MIDIKKQLCLNRNKKYLCFLPSVLPEWITTEKRKELLKTLINSAKEVDCDIIIKLHPSENKEEVQELVSKVTKHKKLRIILKSFCLPKKASLM